MRRLLASAILGPSLLIASLAWSSFGLLNTALDPDRSERIADTLLEDELVQAQLRQSIAGAVGSQIPEGVPVSDDQLESGAGVALENPVVAVLIRDAFVQAHQAFLGEGEPPTTLDIGAAATEVRDGALSGVPGASEIIPDGPGLVIDLPTEQIPNLGGFRRWLQRVAPLMALIALAGAALALLTAKNRSLVLRRAGSWALGSAAIWLVLNIGVPWVAMQFFSGQAAIAASLIDAMFGEMLVPSLVLAGAGIVLVVLSALWPTGEAAAVQRTDGGGVLMRRQAFNEGPKPTPLYEAPPGGIQPQYVAQHQPASQPRPPVDNRPTGVPQQQHTQQVQQAPQVSPPAGSSTAPRTGQPAPPSAPPSRPTQPTQRPVERAPETPGEWVPGVGYVADEPPAAPATTGFERPQSPVRKPAETRWVAGVGYVDEDGNPIDT